MSQFKVVMVIQDANPLLDWVEPRLAEGGVELAVHICWNREDLVCWAADADLVWAYGGRHGLLEGENLDLLQRCKAILRTGSGTDNIDIGRATELGILVVNTPEATVDPVSDQAISLLFALVRRIVQQDRLVRQGVWKAGQVPPFRRFSGAFLGFVGFGRVPQAIARKLVGFGMHYTAYDPYVPPERMAPFGVRPVSLEELLRTSDYMSLHCPLTEETHRLIDAPRLRLMQPHALLVNTSRGQVVDEGALIRALSEGWIAGAALDVLAEEPPSPDHPLLHMDNVIITPHASGHADTFPQEFLEASVAAIIAISRGTRPASVVNPFVKPRDARLAVADAAQSPEDRESHL